MKLTLPQASKNQFCMPYALACLTGKTIDECVGLLKEKLGDVAITGVFFPVGRRILLDQGFTCRDIDRDKKESPESEKTYLVEIPGHAVVVHNKKIYDNGSELNGRYVSAIKHVLRMIEVEKPDGPIKSLQLFNFRII